jgi:glycine/D-amino acid oxidase-like deaminating enzyme
MPTAAASPTLPTGPWDALVVGAGIHGLCTAFWLVQRGVRRLAVLDRHGPGHALGSSHGSTRITRSSYHEAKFVRLAEAAHRDGWPTLERALAQPLRLPTPGVFHGPADGPFGAYLAAAAQAPNLFEPLSTAAAAARFPVLRFASGEDVLHDRSAAVVLAARTMAALRAWLAGRGVQFGWHQPVQHLEADAHGVRAETAQGCLRAAAAVVAAGPDLATLAADLAPPLTVVHQQVGYFALDAAAAALEPGTFPVWAHVAPGATGFTYGLPAVDGAGAKAAVHRTAAPPQPDHAIAEPDPAELLAMARARFAVPVLGLAATEQCRYTMTPDQDFRVARRPAAPLVGIAACSGHGFKFGPEIGRQAAALLLG